MMYLPTSQLPGVHALFSTLATILPAGITAREEESSARPHDRTDVFLSLKRGIFPLETKAKNRTNAIFLFFIMPSLILQGQEADINNNYILIKISIK
jgi:hypothetical protein